MSDQIRLVAEVDALCRLTPRDQQLRPLCVPMAVTAAHELARASTSTLAPEALWQHAFQRDLASSRGTYLSAIREALRDQGQPEEEHWPYDPAASDPIETPRAALGATWFTAPSAPTLPSIADVQFELFGGTPVVVILDLTEAFFNPVAGVISDPVEAAAKLGGHAVLLVAYGERDGSGWFLIHNSWGTEWGIGGRAWISAAHLQSSIRDAAVVQAAGASSPSA